MTSVLFTLGRCALLEQEASIEARAFGEGGSDGCRMLTTSLVALVRSNPNANPNPNPHPNPNPNPTPTPNPNQVAFVRDEPGALLALTQVATAKALSILDISSRSRSRSDAWPAMGAFEVRVRLHSLAQLEELTTALEQLPQARP